MEFMGVLHHPILMEIADIVFLSQGVESGHQEANNEKDHANVDCAFSCLSYVRNRVEIVAVHHIVTETPLDSLAKVIVKQQVLLLQLLKLLLRLEAVRIEAIHLYVPMLSCCTCVLTGLHSTLILRFCSTKWDISARIVAFDQTFRLVLIQTEADV